MPKTQKVHIYIYIPTKKVSNIAKQLPNISKSNKQVPNSFIFAQSQPKPPHMLSTCALLEPRAPHRALFWLSSFPSMRPSPTSTAFIKSPVFFVAASVSFARRLLSSVSFSSFVPFFFYLLCPFSFLGILLFGRGLVVVVVFAFAPSSSSTPSKAQSVIPDSVWAQAAFAAIFVARCHTWLQR